MENEVKKVGCCENKDGAKCEHGMSNCCQNWKKCHIIKWIMIIVLFMIIFCMGSEWGEIKSELKNNRFEKGGMMNWKGNKFDDTYKVEPKKAMDEVTVEVNKLPTAPAAPKQ